MTFDTTTGAITYSHDGTGTTDSFTYVVSDNDGAVSNEALVSINITDNTCGNSVEFDGTSDWINIPDQSFAGDFTIEAWIKFAPGVDNKDALVGEIGFGQDINFFEGKMRLFAGSDRITANTPIAAGQWTHVAITRSGSILTAYYNGVEDGTGTWAGVFTPKALGRGAISNNGQFGGVMDDVRFWNIARTPSEINQNYNLNP